MSELGYWRKANQKGYQKAIAQKEFLHENSRELLTSVRKMVPSADSIMEVGCGAGRNLVYLMDAYHPSRIVGTDLSRNACFEHMDPRLKSVIEFITSDSRDLFAVSEFEVDLLLFSDHLMHLPPEAVRFIIDRLCSGAWKFRHLVIRDTDIPRQRKPIKYAHDYSKLTGHFKVLADESSAREGYFIRIYGGQHDGG